MLDSRRLGRFTIASSYIECSAGLVRRIMGQVSVLRAEYILAENHIEYVAESPHFDEIPLGVKPPEYAVIIEDHGNAITFKRQ